MALKDYTRVHAKLDYLTYKNIPQNTPPLGSQVAAFPCLTQLNLL